MSLGGLWRDMAWRMGKDRRSDCYHIFMLDNDKEGFAQSHLVFAVCFHPLIAYPYPYILEIIFWYLFVCELLLLRCGEKENYIPFSLVRMQ